MSGFPFRYTNVKDLRRWLARRRPTRFPWLLSLLFWLAALALLLWLFRSVSLYEILRLLRSLSPLQLLFLLLANALILFLIPGRWYFFLRAQGYPLSYLRLTRYRLAAFGLSYLTPGPQFGGEPLQLLFLERNHAVPRPVAVASISLDKALELLINFTILLLGVLVVLEHGVFPARIANRLLLVSLLLLLLPLLFLGALWRKRRPFTALFSFAARFPTRWRLPLAAAGERVYEVEEQTASLFRRRPGALFAAFLCSLLAWLALIAEFWLMLAFLGLPLGASQLAVLLTATRLSLLLPLPGGLGTLEAALVLGLESQGLPAAPGLAAGLLIRARDTLLALAGLWSTRLPSPPAAVSASPSVEPTHRS